MDLRNCVLIGVVAGAFTMACSSPDPNRLTSDMQTSADDLRSTKAKGSGACATHTAGDANETETEADDGDGQTSNPRCADGGARTPAPRPTTTTSAPPPPAPTPTTTATTPPPAPAPTPTTTATTPPPAPAPAIDGAALYTQYCAGCHGTSKKGSSATSIQNAIDTIGAMSSLSFLTPQQIAAISAAP